VCDLKKKKITLKGDKRFDIALVLDTGLLPTKTDLPLPTIEKKKKEFHLLQQKKTSFVLFVFF
jgi:hypothetical protein